MNNWQIYYSNYINMYTTDIIKLYISYLMLQETNVFTVISPSVVLRLLPLYWATSESPVDKSTCTCSNTFFFGFNWASGSVQCKSTYDIAICIASNNSLYCILNWNYKMKTFWQLASAHLNIFWKYQTHKSLSHGQVLVSSLRRHNM